MEIEAEVKAKLCSCFIYVLDFQPLKGLGAIIVHLIARDSEDCILIVCL